MSPRITHHGETFRWYWQGKSYELRAGDMDEAVRVGQMLWDECIKSVRYRYPDDDHGQLPGPVGESFVFERRDLRTLLGLDLPQVFMSCDCYDYQTCEHEDYEQSEAWAFLQALRARAWRSLPGYQDSKWGAPEMPKQGTGPVLLSTLLD
jgi:hypothetical protein